MKYDYELGTLYHADCLEVLQGLPSNSVDSVVSDPPAGIAFMNLDFDNPDAWQFPVSKHGFTDGGDRVAAPTIGASSRNPNCRKCKRHKRGWKDTPGCECAEPDFDDRASHLETRDKFVGWLTAVMAEALRVLKPGGHALVWSLPRTSHWTATAIEEAGFEIRDSILHCFGQGFPKSLNIGKAIDKMKGAERTEVVGVKPGHEGFVNRETKGHLESFGDGNSALEGFDRPWMHDPKSQEKYHQLLAPASPEAAQWEGWGTSLKPAVEIWWLARKPIQAQNVASQVLKTGTGGLNIDTSRVRTAESLDGGAYSGERREKGGEWQSSDRSDGKGSGFRPGAGEYKQPSGRWPANLVLSHSPECKKLGTKKVKAITGTLNGSWRKGHQYSGGWSGAEEGDLGTEIGYGDTDGNETVEDWECVEGCPIKALDEQSGVLSSAIGRRNEQKENEATVNFNGRAWSVPGVNQHGDTGGASRFFHNFEPDYDAPFYYTGKITAGERKQDLEEQGLINKHPTVKSIKLMSYFVKLVTPPGGTVLDPFAGSGSTLVAAVQNGFRFIGIEKDDEYIKIAQGRLDKAVEREVVGQEMRDDFNELMGF